MTTAEIERVARVFLERCRAEGQLVTDEAFDDIVRREVALTLRQRHAIRRAAAARQESS